ncbi:MAG TPA: helix-hairpin-helix domain-containing protein [Thermoanaerobaculia bacterium]|nr:helix-hairpin-helix domain-containing protein [Thermoanaerobaculia bacterium]
MRKSHITVAILILITLCTSAFAQSQSASAAPSGVVNINTADASQLAYLPHVGVKAAQRILDYRKAHGSFAKVTDLMEVKGIGEKSFERLRPFLTVDGKTTLAEKVHGARKPRSTSSKKTKPATPAN